MSIPGINPTNGPKPSQSVQQTNAVEKSTGSKFDVPGNSQPSSAENVPDDGPEVSQAAHQMTQTIRDGVAAGEDRREVFNRVVNEQIDAQLGTDVPAGVREQATEIMASNPVLREMYDRLFTAATQQNNS